MSPTKSKMLTEYIFIIFLNLIFNLIFYVIYVIYLFRLRRVLVATCGIFFFSCGMRHLVPRPWIEPGPPALGAQSLTQWTTREVPEYIFNPIVVTITNT